MQKTWQGNADVRITKKAVWPAQELDGSNGRSLKCRADTPCGVGLGKDRAERDV